MCSIGMGMVSGKRPASLGAQGEWIMSFRERVLMGSASIAALVCASPALAATTDASSSTVSEVVVTGIKQSLQQAITIKKQSVDQVDAISAEDIGKLPDHNVADALQRIPGVNTQ